MLVAPIDTVYPRQMRRNVLNGTRSHALIPNAQVAIMRGRQQIARHPIEAHLGGARHAHGAQRQDGLARIAQIPEMRERVDGTAGQQVRLL